MCIDLRKTKTKMIIGPFYTYRRIHFTGGNASDGQMDRLGTTQCGLGRTA